MPFNCSPPGTANLICFFKYEKRDRVSTSLLLHFGLQKNASLRGDSYGPIHWDFAQILRRGTRTSSVGPDAEFGIRESRNFLRRLPEDDHLGEHH